MKHFVHVFLASAMVLLAGCNPFKDEVDELYNEIAQLQSTDDQILNKLESLNSDVSSMLKIVNSIRAGVYIKSIASVTDSEGRDGYVITLNNGETFTIYDGKDGVDGYSPSVGVKLDPNDGVYYWTLDGEYMTDVLGGKIRADGAKPSFEIRNGSWHISYDGGKTWQDLKQKATGQSGVDGVDGKSLFDVIYTSGANVVTFVMTDTGERITLPCYQPTTLSFNVDNYSTGIAAGETIEIKYNIFNGYENTVVTASSDGNYKVSVDNTNATSGSIFVTCPGLYMDGHVNIMAFDGIGYASIYVISFFEKTMSVSETSKSFGSEGGSFELSLTHNFSYYLDFDSKETASWVSVTKVEGSDNATKYRVDVAKNGGNDRKGYINIYSSNTSGTPFAKVEITQEGSTFTMEQSNFVVTADKTTVSTTIQTTRKLNLDCSAKWIKAELKSGSNGSYTVNINIDANSATTKRGATIHVISEGDNLADIEVIQLAKGDEHGLDMIFTVRASEATDYTVYLPIKRTEKNSVDCIIDWGDGTQEHVYWNTKSEQGSYVYHKYEKVYVSGKDFTVSISGTVKVLSMSNVPDGRKASITAVKQWGNTGLTNMQNAFNLCTSLTSIPEDKARAFSEVKGFANAFTSCWGLTEVPAELFSTAKKATSFKQVFSDCRNLKRAPSKLFAGCVSATTFEGAFQSCTALTTAADDIFANCGKATSYKSLFNGCSALKVQFKNIFSDSPEVTDFASIFQNCTSMTTLTKQMFAKNTKVTTFASSFAGCSALREIPEGLFDACTEVTTFSSVFTGCQMLTSIPTHLFDNQTMVTNFSLAFSNCKNVACESPYTELTNGKKVHLYERADYPDYFVTPTSTSKCFAACSKLYDYQTIVNNYSAWK